MIKRQVKNIGEITVTLYATIIYYQEDKFHLLQEFSLFLGGWWVGGGGGGNVSSDELFVWYPQFAFFLV